MMNLWWYKFIMNKNTPQKYELHVKRLTVYLDPTLDAQIRQLSKLEDRSLSNVAERAFRAYISLSSPQLAEVTP